MELPTHNAPSRVAGLRYQRITMINAKLHSIVAQMHELWCSWVTSAARALIETFFGLAAFFCAICCGCVIEILRRSDWIKMSIKESQAEKNKKAMQTYFFMYKIPKAKLGAIKFHKTLRTMNFVLRNDQERPSSAGQESAPASSDSRAKLVAQFRSPFFSFESVWMIHDVPVFLLVSACAREEISSK